jgi:response regulator of citrate/malate metabolism
MNAHSTKSILVIEDEPVTRTLYVNYISKLVPDFHLYEADNVLEGACLCFEKHPDLILLDIIMPDYGGELLLDLMEEGISKDILSFSPKIIVISSIESAEELMTLTKKIAVASVIPKPLPFDTLEELIKIHLQMN